MICRRTTYFIDSEMIGYHQKTCGWNRKSMKSKDYVRNYARTHYLWFMLGPITVMRISK